MPPAMPELSTIEILIRSGGPFVAAFGMLTICGLILWKYALQPAFVAVIEIQKQSTQSSLEHTVASQSNLAAAKMNNEAALVNKSIAELITKLADKLLERLK